MKQREVVLCIIAIAIFIIAGASSCKLIKAVTKPLPIEYNIGTGIAKVTDPAIGLGMQGMADDKQKTTGVESDLYARAFIIHHINSNKRIVLLNADIWSCVYSVKAEVIKRLQNEFGNLYNDENVLLSGTHNHSGPGGYNYYYLYNHSMRGFDAHNFECIVSGMVTAIRKAHANLAPGRLYLQAGEVADCGRNRSSDAYNNNPRQERDQYQSNTDKEMILLKFVKVIDSTEKPVGILTWYGIHPTDRGQKNTLVNGDNKGYASWLFEKDMGTDYTAQETFVAAFANSLAGDVSGNVEYGKRPDNINDKSHMESHGRRQYAAAKDLYANAVSNLTIISGPVDFKHEYVDMVGKTGAPGSLGLSMFAGSTEDSDPGSGLKEGIVEGDVLVTEWLVRVGIATMFGIPAGGVPYATAIDLTPAEVSIHSPKPITLVPGYTRNGMVPLTPTILPLQLIRVGQLAVVGFPGELTTMAGRRLRSAILKEFDSTGISKVAINTYANDYAQYTATEQEYQKQHYEGASTLFGPKSLDTYIAEYVSLASAIKTGSTVAAGPLPPDLSASCKKIQRITIRNETPDNKSLSFYNINDPDLLIPRAFAPNMIPDSADLFFSVEGLPGGKDVKVVVNNNKHNVVSVHYGQLLRILPDGSLQVTGYVPPPR